MSSIFNSALPDAAVFIDGDWLHYAARRLNKEVDYTRLWETLHDHFGPKTPIYFFGAVDPQNPDQKKFLSSLAALGYIVELASLVRTKDRVFIKGLDVRLAVRAVSLPPDFRNIVLISGDSDFIPLLEQLRRNGKSPIVITIPPAARALVRASDNHFIDLEKLLDNLLSGKGLPRARRKKSKIVPPSSWYIEKGEYFAPYLAIRELLMSAKSEIIIVDPYIDDQILYMIHLLKPTITVRILTNKISPADFCIQLKKLRSEGYEIHVHKTNAFHDRFLGIDDRWWHSGHSFKDLGGKDSLVNRIQEESALQKIRKRVSDELNNSSEYCI